MADQINLHEQIKNLVDITLKATEEQFQVSKLKTKSLYAKQICMKSAYAYKEILEILETLRKIKHA